LHYVYPIRTDHITGLPVKELSVRVSVESDVEISNIYSPTHRIDIDRKSDTSFVAGFETRDTLETTDFSLYYGVATEDINLNLLTYRESANEDGFFLALISPPFDIEEEKVLPKDVIVVLDNSGSMYGVKWEQAVEAAKFVLDNLNDEDRFNIVSFSTSVRIYANELQGVDEVDDAKDWLSTIEAIGGTNINEALQTALEMNEGERQTVLLFLTDGLATEGETETAEILKNVEAKARGNMSLFAFGVGNDVDTFLLDQLSAAYRGASAYVRPEESITEEVGNLYNKIRAPLFTHILLDIDGVDIYDVFPDSHNLPDLFVGSQLVIVGRYRGDTDNATLVLSGQVGDDDVNFSYENLRFRTNAGGEVLIPRLWATRKIGDLLNAIRLHGENPELVDSIVRLSIRYGIITPYTSFLITEDDIFSQTGRDRAMTEAEEATFGLDDTVSGEAAVNAAEASRDLSQAEIPSPAPTIGLSSKSNVGQSGAGGGSADGDEVAQAPGDFGGVVNPVQYVSDRTFVYRDGKWIDTLYDADTMEVEKIEFLSDAYFDLLDEDERVAEFYALGDAVIFVLDEVAYEIVPEAAE
jgi:Ca-activated chloride channel family protein